MDQTEGVTRALHKQISQEERTMNNFSSQIKSFTTNQTLHHNSNHSLQNESSANYKRNTRKSNKPKKFNHQKPMRNKFKRSNAEKMLNKMKMMIWNVDGGMNKNSKKHDLTLFEINTFKPSILLTQETLGTKGTGYKRQNKNKCGEPVGMKLICIDECGVTAIFLRDDVKDYIKIDFPPQLFNNIHPKDVIHATAVVIFSNQKIQSRDKVVIVNVYRSPAVTAISLRSMTIIINYVKSMLKDDSPNIIMGGDLNFWSELNGSDPNKRTVYPQKFKAGDVMIETMKQQRMSIVSNKEPTMWKRNPLGTIDQYSVDSLWMNNNLRLHIQMKHHFDQEVTVSDHYPNKILTNQIHTHHKSNQGEIAKWRIDQATEAVWMGFKKRC